MLYTKNIKIIVCFIVLLTSVLETSISNDIFQETLNDIRKKYKWKKRILLVISDKNNNSLIREVDNFFLEKRCDNNERNLRLLKVFLHKKNDVITKYEKVKGIFLIGYDGTVKAHSKDSSLLLTLYNTIDNMPLRKKEMKSLRSIC